MRKFYRCVREFVDNRIGGKINCCVLPITLLFFPVKDFSLSGAT